MSAFHPTFVSHAHADNDLCDRYVAALRARGIDIWYDRDNAQNGHLLGSAIQDELKRRSAFVLLMTEASLNSFWVDLEMQTYLGLLAQQRSRLLLPVRIGSCAVPPMLNAFFWIDAQAMPFEKAIDAIATALTAQGAVAAQPSAVTTPPREALPPLGPAPAPANSVSALHLTPSSLYNLGFRGYSVGGVECILPPLCPVPAGIFTMGSDENRDKETGYREKPQFPVAVEAFAIGQYPVTVAEYDCAIRAEAVREPPRCWGVDWAMQQTHPDYPVVCVWWNDAIAYTRWLAKLTSQLWRLPSEAEWEKAARGTDGRIYPYGDKFNKNRCNTKETGIGAAIAIGRYPSGESPYHVQDMSGNVWEWTSSLDAPYPYRKDDGRESLDSHENRVLRGGAWDGNSRQARTAFREHMGLIGLGNNYQVVGCRLVYAAAGSA